jgi:response regulator RpfG family c-di-GMP phosphodiesterase
MKLHKILIFETQDVNAFYGGVFRHLTPFFAGQGFEFLIQSVPTAEYGYETIKAYVKQYTPDILIVYDAYLTEDIITFCKNVRNYPETKNIGLFIVSQYACIRADDEWWEKWIGLVDQYMPVPIEMSDLERRLNNVVKKRLD